MKGTDPFGCHLYSHLIISSSFFLETCHFSLSLAVSYFYFPSNDCHAMISYQCSSFPSLRFQSRQTINGQENVLKNVLVRSCGSRNEIEELIRGRSTKVKERKWVKMLYRHLRQNWFSFLLHLSWDSNSLVLLLLPSIWVQLRRIHHLHLTIPISLMILFRLIAKREHDANLTDFEGEQERGRKRNEYDFISLPLFFLPFFATNPNDEFDDHHHRHAKSLHLNFVLSFVQSSKEKQKYAFLHLNGLPFFSSLLRFLQACFAKL